MMAPYLQLDLNSVVIDPQLARRIPYALSRYYMALPLGQDNGSVSVAMAYPENVQAQQVLSSLLQAKVVPVFTPIDALRPLLERIYNPNKRENHPILAWYEQPEWETAVTNTAQILSNQFHTPATACSTTQLTLSQLLHQIATGQFELLILAQPTFPTLTTILNRSAASLFLVRGEPQPIRRILVVIRGFASDEQAMTWTIPLAKEPQTAVTLMPLMNNDSLDLHQYHRPNSPAGQNLVNCLHRLQTKGIPVDLKYRRGNATQQVVEEVADNTYDLLVLAAEAVGNFVSRVITAVTQQNAHHHRPILLIKPPLPVQP